MPFASVLFAFVVGAIVVTVTGGNPIDAYQGLLCGGLGIACTQGENPALQIANTIVYTIPLITTGVAVALPCKCAWCRQRVTTHRDRQAIGPEAAHACSCGSRRTTSVASWMHGSKARSDRWA